MAHKHSAPSGDGGELSESITNFSGGAVGEVLTATATDIPEWASSGGAATPVTFLGSDRVTTPRNTMTVSISPTVSGSDIGKITACWTYQAVTDPSNWRITVNGITTAGFYNTQRCTLNGASVVGSLESAGYIEGMASASRMCYGLINCFAGSSEATGGGNDTMFAAQGSWASNGSGQYRGGFFTCAADTGGVHSDTFNSFTEIEIECDGGNFQQGSSLMVYSNNIS